MQRVGHNIPAGPTDNKVLKNRDQQLWERVRWAPLRKSVLLMVEDLGRVRVLKCSAEVCRRGGQGDPYGQQWSSAHVRQHRDLVVGRPEEGDDGRHDAEEDLGARHAALEELGRVLEDAFDNGLGQGSVDPTTSHKVDFRMVLEARQVLVVFGAAVVLGDVGENESISIRLISHSIRLLSFWRPSKGRAGFQL